jgi:glucose dehydrogenase
MVVPYAGVPTIIKNVIVVGATTGEQETGPPGNPRAFDARTGGKLWEFQTVPKPGQPGSKTWLNDGWKDRAGANAGGWYMTADESRGILYMTLGSPKANYYGGDRPGANLFANSIAWRTTLGLNLALPPGRQTVGNAGSAGPIVTAGGLLFIGATDDGRFRAFDSTGGKELWAGRLQHMADAVPITYLGKNGKQYVAITATDQVVAFVLPDQPTNQSKN